MSQNDQVIRLPLPTDGPLDAPDAWQHLRERCPVANVELPSGDTGTLLTRYEDVKALLSDPRFAHPTAGDRSARLAPEGAGGASADGTRSFGLPLTGEAHLRWRRRVGRYFTAKRMAALRPRIRGMAEALAGDMIAGGRPADLRAALAAPLPIHVICELLGAPAADRERFSQWSDAFLNVTRFSKEEITAAQSGFASYMAELVAAKHAEPAEDVLSMLIRQRKAEGEGPSDTELAGIGMALLVAGQETTANIMAKMFALILADRTRWERLLADPSLVRSAVDEVLRFDANLGGFGIRRYIGEDVRIGDELLPGGTTVFCALSSANRDERVFTDPDRMDLDRSPNPHLTFGTGPHSCLGQSLARTELQVALEVLLRTLPTLELAVPVEELHRIQGLEVGGLREVPVRW
ncbi:cytochrome P450 [Nocardiopsis sediminis]|uniref:Cytochrome P450 n=1 Tax=Nocardiopsis sediminis TaxID=1778267 RepID=A0ABV8FQP0_9ACTN